jgi:PAS domain S-box-containing protein
MPAPRLRRGLVVFALTWLSYAAFGWLGVQLSISSGHASPLFPAAGIALVAVLQYGRPAAAAVLLASFAINWRLGMAGAGDVAGLVVPAVIGLGAMLQALAGAALVRRFVRQPLTLTEPRDIAAFYGFGAFAACLVSATLGTAALGLAGTLSNAQLAFNGLTWWLGDSLGTLIAAPIVLTLVGQPRDEWAPRRLALGLALTLATLLMAALIVLMSRWDDERAGNTFEREALGAASILSFRLLEPLHALEALRGVYLASSDVTPEAMRRASSAWLDGSGQLYAMGFIERVPRADIPAFEARQRAALGIDYHVFERHDAGADPAAAAEDVMAMKYIEHMAANLTAFGLNVRSVPIPRAAIDNAIRTDRPAATAAFTLTQRAQGQTLTGVVVYHAIYAGTPSTVAERTAAVRGAVFVTLRMEDTLRAVADQIPHYLKVCVVDTDALAAQRRLFGPPGCESSMASLLYVQPMPFAGRQWDLRIYADPADLPGAGDSNAWLFSVVGLVAAAVLGALLLTVTGRTRRIEAAVRERTAALEQEVREREQAEAAMRQSEQRFRNIFNNVPIGVFYTDLQGQVKQTNPRFCELVGYSADELLGMTAHDFTHPDDTAQDVELATQLIRGDFPVYRRQKRYIDKSGRVFPVQTMVTLLRDESGRPSRIVGTVEDITEHLQLAEAERAREAAEASNHAKSDFLSRMSHELRTPLNAMLGFAQLLELDQRHPLASSQRPWVAQIQGAGWHLLEMINDVLDLSRIESGNLRLDPAPLELPGLLATTLTMIEGEARKRDIVVSQEFAPDALRVRGDATRVKQILTNLLSNAVKYNIEGGRIHVASQRRDDLVEVIVSDTGLGMSEDQMSELFQPFNRLGRERSAQEGTGIGLVISQRLAELMGGSLRARSVAGTGSSFILSLPAAPGADGAPADGDEPITETRRYHRRVVHYVEDNETNVEVMRGVLAQRPQIRMDVSLTGLVGLAAIRARRPSLILLDMHLPDISGMELLRQLKADPSTASVPIVVVSADALTTQIEAALDAGAERYLTKPVSVTELLGVLDELLEGAETRFG